MSGSKPRVRCRDTGGRGRTLAMLASSALMLAGLIGVGVAAPASADAAPTCPADTAETTWELQGNVCVGTTTETAAPEQGDSTWACPEGYGTPDDPVTASSTCTKPVEKVQDYKCPRGYSSNDNPVTSGSVCTKTETETEDASRVCVPSGNRDDSAPQTRDRNRCDGEWEYQCDAGWTLGGKDGKECSREVVKEKSPEKDGRPYCPASVSTPTLLSPSDHDEQRGCPPLTADPIETQHWMCPTGFLPEGDVSPETTCERQTQESQTAICPEGDVLTNIGDEEVANWQCITPETPVVPTAGQPRTFTATGSASGSQDICLADGVTTSAVTYNVTGDGSGPTQGDADYAANVATVAAVNAAIAAQTPEGATVGACGAAGAAEPVVTVAAPEAATIAEEPADEPEAVAVPQAATVPAAVPAGDGSSQPATPTGALLLTALGALGVAATSLKWVLARR